MFDEPTVEMLRLRRTTTMLTVMRLYSQAPKSQEAAINRVAGTADAEAEEEPIDEFLHLPDEIRNLKTMKIPDHIPRNESQMAAHPVAAMMQQFFIVPILVLFYVIYRMVKDPFGDGGYTYRIAKRDTDIEEHYEMHPEAIAPVLADRETRRRFRKETS